MTAIEELFSFYTELTNMAELVAPDSPYVAEARYILDESSPDRYRTACIEFEHIEDDINKLAAVPFGYPREAVI